MTVLVNLIDGMPARIVMAAFHLRDTSLMSSQRKFRPARAHRTSDG